MDRAWYPMSVINLKVAASAAEPVRGWWRPWRNTLYLSHALYYGSGVGGVSLIVLRAGSEQNDVNLYTLLAWKVPVGRY